jgi:hypothetical protein
MEFSNAKEKLRELDGARFRGERWARAVRLPVRLQFLLLAKAKFLGNCT